MATDVIYEEPIIEAKQFKPEFHMKQVTEMGSYRNYTRNVPTIILKGKDKEEFVLQGKPYARFLQFLQTGQRKFHAIVYDTEKTWSGRIKRVYKTSVRAQEFLDKAYKEITTDKFKLLLADGKVARITSDEYIGIPHTFVQEVIEKRLDTEGFVYEKKISPTGQTGEYTLETENGMNREDAIAKAKEVSKQMGMHQFAEAEIGGMVRYFNNNSGDKSLKLFGGGTVLVCANGVIIEGGSGKQKIRLVHKLDMPMVRRRIEETLTDILKNIKPMQKQLLSLRELSITKEEAKKFVGTIPVPKYMQAAIWQRLFTKSENTRYGEMDWDGTLWGIFMASTYIASHHDKVSKGRGEKLLEDEIKQKLSTYETFKNAWDKREKELEKTNAKKVEATK